MTFPIGPIHATPTRVTDTNTIEEALRSFKRIVGTVPIMWILNNKIDTMAPS
jgi:hypothetical protein